VGEVEGEQLGLGLEQERDRARALGLLAGAAQGLVDHALDDHRTGGVVGRRLGPEREHADPSRVDPVSLDQPEHRVGVLVGAAHTKAAADDRGDLGPGRSGPLAPTLEIDGLSRTVAASRERWRLFAQRQHAG
jgi:hypothetical protein